MEMFKVTYRNFIDGKRHTLIDDVDKESAEAVVRTFGDKNDPMYYMPGLKIEEMI